MHFEAYAWIAQSLQMMPEPTAVLELGSRNINGSPRTLLPRAQYLGVDITEGAAVDLVANAADYTPERPFDLVLCCEVLEHAPEAAAIVANAVRCAAPGGHILITCASEGRQPHSAVDGGAVREGEHYRNVLPGELRAWLESAGAQVLDLEQRVDRGDVYVMARRPA